MHFKKQVMLFDEIKKNAKGEDNKIEFTKEELEFLLTVVGECTFKGKSVQRVYDTALKLQTMLKQLQ